MNVPIAMFHQVEDAKPEDLKDWSINHQKFSAFLDQVEQSGLQTTTFEEIFLQSLSATQLREKVIITFDDCAAGLMRFAVPELIRRNMKAVFYIPTAHINRYNQWDVEEQGFDQISLMDETNLLFLRDQGMEIGSHGHRHLRHNLVDESIVYEEFSKSKDILEKLLEKQVYSLAHPYGEVSKRYRLLMEHAGYHYGVGIYSAFENQFCLRRFGIHQSDSPKSIRFKLGRRYRLFRSVLDPILEFKRRLKA